jgi:hypothetical protein
LINWRDVASAVDTGADAGVGQLSEFTAAMREVISNSDGALRERHLSRRASRRSPEGYPDR